ncbi:RHS repeat-associated core domain-containing protein [Pseudomonas sp. JR33AA]|uniref:RHS repeat-associated core domain-containing protein n=1 Tax=Pseudomonas sp. JR33AA TaxID=2899113 RepID=UPI003FA38206
MEREEGHTYSAYGYSATLPSARTSVGFNGEYAEPLTGFYILGSGYRAYSPRLMRFLSQDSLSPFGAGGINAYAYCTSDPINNSDPSGHSNLFIRFYKGVLNRTGLRQRPMQPARSNVSQSSNTRSINDVASSSPQISTLSNRNSIVSHAPSRSTSSGRRGSVSSTSSQDSISSTTSHDYALPPSYDEAVGNVPPSYKSAAAEIYANDMTPYLRPSRYEDRHRYLQDNLRRAFDAGDQLAGIRRTNPSSLNDTIDLLATRIGIQP